MGQASRLSPPQLPKQAYGRDARATSCTPRIFLSYGPMPTRVNDVVAVINATLKLEALPRIGQMAIHEVNALFFKQRDLLRYRIATRVPLKTTNRQV